MPDVTPLCLDIPTPDGTMKKSINLDILEFMPNFLTPDLNLLCETHSLNVINGSIDADPVFSDTTTLNVKINEHNSDSQVNLTKDFTPDSSNNTSNTNATLIDCP